MPRVRALLGCALLILLTASCANKVSGLAEVGPQPAPVESTAGTSTDGSVPPASEIPLPSDISVPPGTSLSDPTTAATHAPSSDPTVPAVETTSSSAGTTTTPRSTPSPSTPGSVSRPTKLHCAVAALTAKGAPFCYDIPDGFKDISTTATYSGSDRYRTAVEFYTAAGGSTRDLIVVTALTLSIDADQLTDAALFGSIRSALDGGISGVKSVSPLTRATVAGDRAFQTTLTFTNGDQKRYLLVFAGTHRVSVSCQWRDHQAGVTAACTKVLASLQIAYP